MTTRLVGKVACITGATKGIGAVVAERLASEGACVVVSTRRAGSGDALVESIEAAGGKALCVRADVSDPSEARQFIERVVEWGGALDILVNNAANTDLRGDRADQPLADESLEIFELNFRATLMPVVYCCKFALPHMIEHGSGAIVNLSSVCADLGLRGLPAYSAAKGAVNALTRQLAVDYGPAVRVNAISVGSVDSGDAEGAFKRNDPVVAEANSRIYVTRLGERRDIAGAVAFLASDDAAFVSGTTLDANGGATIKMGLPDMTKLSFRRPGIESTGVVSERGLT
jgi:NAD(P)-dependent dehydrogenase (short-subunit alcohol dehydrogenase family)